MEKKYILAIDSGSTGIRAILFNFMGDIVAREYEKTPAMYPEPGAIEHDPEMLWNALLSVVKKVLSKPEFSPATIAAIGICNQRGSFMLWDKNTGQPVTNFINWADVRAADTTDAMNRHSKWLLLKEMAKLVSKLTGSMMMTATSMMSFTTDHASMRLKWLLDHNPTLFERCKKDEIRFSTLDSWFIYRLTGKKNHVTDYSNAASTGLLNPFQLEWNKIFCDLFKIPINIFPKVIDSNGDFGSTDPTLFNGVSIPIRSAIGDQQGALFGQTCFAPGDVKISQGSGAFVDMNVGPKARLSKRGLFPLVGWVINGKPTYMLEGYVATAGTLIDWLGQGIGLSETPQILNEFASKCETTEGVVFLPAPSGIRFPYFNPRVKGSILGLSLSTHRCHVARAVLEGIALSIRDVISGMAVDTKIPIQILKVDGGVSKSDILLQSLSNYANLTVKRAPEADMTATGCAYLAGLGAGIWKDLYEIKRLEKNYTEFTPKIDPKLRQQKLNEWDKAVHAMLQLY